MPKILIYATAKVIWTFLIYGSDFNENRAHVHVGKAGNLKLCKIWIEPEVSVADNGELTDKQIAQVLSIAKKYQNKFLEQWQKFKDGDKVRIIKVNE